MLRLIRSATVYSITALVLLLISVVLLQNGYAQPMDDNLAGRVASLQLGMDGYVIGTRLTAAQKETAGKNTSSDAYRGTYKITAGDLVVVIAADDDTILAIYQRHETADMDQAKFMVSGLMGLFGEPTTMAHDKMIYWVFTDNGKVEEEKYRRLRKNNEDVQILATVKFSSDFAITGEQEEQKNTGINYFIVSSDPLIQEFMKRNR